MTRWILAGLLVVAPTLAFGLGSERYIQINQFGGLNTDDPTIYLQNGQTPDSENVVTDEGPGLGPRNGFASFSTETFTSGWELPHSNGTKYSIIHSGNNLKASDGDGTYDIQISTLAASVVTSGAVLGNRFYWTNTVDGLKYVEISGITPTVTVVDAAFGASMLVTHKARLWAAGFSSAPRTLKASKFNDGTDWTLVTDPAATDPAQFVIGGALDEPLTAIYASHVDKLVWFKNRSFGGIIGSDRSDFEVRTYSDQIGTAYGDSVKDCDGLLRFIGPARTIWEFDGAAYRKISDDIDALMATVSQGDASSRAYQWTTQADFNTGTNSDTSNTLTSGSVLLSTWSATDTTGAQFGAGTLTNVDTTTVSGSLYLSRNYIDSDLNNIFSLGGLPDGWSISGSNVLLDTTYNRSPYSGFLTLHWSGGFTQGTYPYPVWFNIDILDADGNVLASKTGGGGNYNFTGSVVVIEDNTGGIRLGAYSGRTVRVKVSDVDDSSSYLLSPLIFCTTNTSVGWIFGQHTTAPYDVYFAALRLYDYSTIHNGNIVSQSFDTAISSPAWAPSTPTVTSNGHTVTFQTQVSDDNATWDSLVSWTTGTAPASANKRYVRYKISFSTASAGTGYPHVDAVPLIARAKTGSWISNSIPTSQMSSFGAFGESSAADGETITYTVYTDTDASKTISYGVPTADSYTSSQTITNGSIPALSTAAYIFVGAVATVVDPENAPQVNSITLNWNEGSGIRIASSYFNQRYWLGVAISSTSNNRVLVFDKRRQWQRYSGINAVGMFSYNGNLYFGNSSGIFQAETGTDDNGTAITSYYRTKDYAPAGLSIRSYLNSLHCTTENSPSSLVATYQIDGVGSDYTFGTRAMNATVGLQHFKIPFPFSQLNQGRYVNFNFYVSGSDDWKMLNADLEYVPDVQPD